MSSKEQFNEAQVRRILSNLKYVDKLLQDVEGIVTAGSSEAAFPKYRNGLSGVQSRIARDYMSRIRRQILRVLNDLNIEVPRAPFDSVHSIRVVLQFIDIALEECSPRRLVGYGEVAEGLVAPLTGALQEMKAMVSQLDSYVAQGLGRDLEGRLQRLSATGKEVDLVRTLREVIDKHGLVEFRGSLASLVEKLESPGYEIAVFGRVSSGKSSLLNRIIGIDVLPVGVTPVTSVPTKIRNGETEGLSVWFAGGRQESLPIPDLDSFVTEEENPSNQKQVTRVLLQITSPRLPPGVTLVDTPGLGSLALAGTNETLAYLPRCDLGVVVVDASSSITMEDTGTVQKLYDAGTPAVVVLSKVDLVDVVARKRLVEYTAGKLEDELGIRISVRPLSSRSEFEPLLEQWMSEELAPRYERAQELARESVRRKAGGLRDAVMSVLEAMSGRPPSHATRANVDEFRDAERHLRLASGQIETSRNACFVRTDRIRWMGPYLPAALAREGRQQWSSGKPNLRLDASWIQAELVSVAQLEGQEVASLIRNTAEQLTEALDVAANLLPGVHLQDRVDLKTLVKNMPVPEPQIPSISIGRPGWLLRMLGLARWRTEMQLRLRVGPQLTEFCTNHGRLLELWARSTLSELERAFEERAENYRAQLQRFVASPINTASDSSAVESSLTSLRQYSPDPQTSSAV